MLRCLFSYPDLPAFRDGFAVISRNLLNLPIGDSMPFLALVLFLSKYSLIFI